MSLIKVKPGWKKLEGLNNWKAELENLLEEAQAAAKQQATGPRLEVAALFAGYIQESYPQNSEMDLLDEIARKTAVDLMKQTIDERLASIVERTAEYAKMAKALETAAEESEKAAESIRLVGVTRVIEASTEAITSVREFAKSLDTSRSSHQKVVTLIEDTVSTIEALRTAVARLV